MLADTPKEPNNRTTINNLKFIGNIKPLDKINVRHLYVQQDSWRTSFARSLSAENRMTTLKFVNDTLAAAFEIAKSMKDARTPSELCILSNLINDLRMSKIGIANLKITYSGDVLFACSVDSILQMIDSELLNPDLSIVVGGEYELN
jgi:hypothetical protein